MGINQPQADRFLAPALELVLPSIEVPPLAYGTGEAGARNGRESVTGAPRRGRNSLAVELPEVKFVGAHRAPEDGTTVSERSFSVAN